MRAPYFEVIQGRENRIIPRCHRRPCDDALAQMVEGDEEVARALRERISAVVVHPGGKDEPRLAGRLAPQGVRVLEIDRCVLHAQAHL
jgi:hypothetical protein